MTGDFAATYGRCCRALRSPGYAAWCGAHGVGRDRRRTRLGEMLTVFDVTTTPESGQAVTGSRTLWVRLVRSGDAWKLARVEETA